MGLTRLCLNNPAAVAVAVALVFVIGTISLFGLPVQLFPNIERPVVNINTGLRAASPEQVEAEILEPQEEVLRGISGLKETIGWANPGDANLQLYFDFSADQDFIRQEVTARLQRAPALPADANRPFIRFSDEEDANSSLIFFFVQALPGTIVRLRTISAKSKISSFRALRRSKGSPVSAWNRGGHRKKSCGSMSTPSWRRNMGSRFSRSAARSAERRMSPPAIRPSAGVH